MWYKMAGTPYNGFEGNSACETMDGTYINNETIHVIARHFNHKGSENGKIDYDVQLTQTPKGITHTLLHAPGIYSTNKKYFELIKNNFFFVF